MGDESPGFPGEIVVKIDHPTKQSPQPAPAELPIEEPETEPESMMEQEESSFQEETDTEFSGNIKKLMKMKEMKDEKPMMKPDEK